MCRYYHMNETFVVAYVQTSAVLTRTRAWPISTLDAHLPCKRCAHAPSPCNRVTAGDAGTAVLVCVPSAPASARRHPPASAIQVCCANVAVTRCVAAEGAGTTLATTFALARRRVYGKRGWRVLMGADGRWRCAGGCWRVLAVCGWVLTVADGCWRCVSGC